MLRRIMGLPEANDPAANAPDPGAAPRSGSGQTEAPVPRPPAADTNETATVREIVARLESMPRDEAKFLAGFAYVLSRAANADMSISADETQLMERIVVEHGHIDESLAVVVIQIAKTRSELFGQTEDYLVTREFRRVATDEQCLDVLRACYLIGAADDTITAEESGTLQEIAEELNIDATAVQALRAQYAESFSALKKMRQMTGQSPAAQG